MNASMCELKYSQPKKERFRVLGTQLRRSAMEGLQNWVSFSNDTKSASPSLFPVIPYNLRGGGPAAASSALSSADSSRALVTRPPRQVVSLWTCSKLSAICFVAGIVVGYTLKRRVRRWASQKIKRRLVTVTTQTI